MQDKQTIDSLREWWDLFEQRVIPPSAEGTQRMEMEKAFYSGCACLFSMLLHAAESKTEDEASKVYAGIGMELGGFRAEVIGGWAGVSDAQSSPTRH